MGNLPASSINSDYILPDLLEGNSWERMNHYGRLGTPFLFLADFKGEKVEVWPLEELDNEAIRFDIQGFTNVAEQPPLPPRWYFKKQPIPYHQYLRGFELVKDHILFGNSFLVNYTAATPIQTNLSLRQIFEQGHARYKFFYKNRFTFFSPETFVQIKDGIISTCPMKGTIDASLPDAHAQILGDKKETAEHHTIVDLLRNDLSRVSKNVRVERFRYIEKVKTHEKELLQVSSKITGRLPGDWKNYIGDVFSQLLPAGSISGAPKKKTVAIIEEAEAHGRGFYTGIVGVFDGEKVDSGVAIRFIEKTAEGLVFKSGGGITCFSDPAKEYQEMMDKVYLPF